MTSELADELPTDAPYALAGQFEHGLDEKGRFVMPSAFRAVFADGGRMIYWPGPSVGVFTAEVALRMDRYARKRRRAALGNPNARRGSFGTGHMFKPDGQGRVFLPEDFRAFLGIDDRLIVAGISDHLELWKPERWAPIAEEGKQAHLDEVSLDLQY